MRVTNYMLISTALRDLDGLREKYAKSQAAVNGRVLERPSEDPQRVVEAMDLSGAKLRLERAKRSGQDAREWLSVAELGLTNMLDRLQGARELALQAGAPVGMDQDSRESMARNVEAIRDAIKREMNTRHRDQYLYAGWRSDARPFDENGGGGVTYTGGSGGAITRDIAPGLSVVVNVTGNELLSGGDFIQALSGMAADLRAGNTESVTTTRLTQVNQALNNLTVIRSDLGTRQVQVEQYEHFTDASLFQIEDRLSTISGADLEEAVLRMTEAQTAYQAAMASFAKALPTSLIDYMLR